MSDWYLQLDGEEHGPLSEADFLELIRTSIVTPETKMRTSQSSPKPTASKVKGIRFASTDVKRNPFWILKNSALETLQVTFYQRIGW